jgi:beta-glucosidase
VLAALGEDAPQIAPGDLRSIAARCDFLGINYYFPETVADAPGQGGIATRVVHTPGAAQTAFGWPIEPAGMVELLTRVQRDYGPQAVYLTENGACFDDVPDASGRIQDAERQRFLADHFDAARQVLGAGVPLKGYFVWSLLDNFEWAEGYTRRFGLAYVDYASQRRRLKASGDWMRSFLHHERSAA